MSFSLPSYAKINLHLRVFGRRPDGFHEIESLIQTVSLHDTLTFEMAEPRLSDTKPVHLTCSTEGVPLDDTNLVVRAAKALQEKAGRRISAKVHLEKRIPSPGGLGGASSNAAAALIGLSKLWRLDLDFSELLELAGELGSDVPFFLYGGTAIARGRGTDIEPQPDICPFPTLIVTPNVQISTREAYQALDADSLTSQASNRNLFNYRFGHFDAVNDFEKTVFDAFSEIAKVKARLLELGAAQASMSGSGASVFGIFDNEETRQTALKALGERTDWRSFAVAAVSRREYRERLGIADQ